MKQLALPDPPTWGGRRRGAGRRRQATSGVMHRPRPIHKKQHPVHVTVKFVPNLPSLRRHDLYFPIFDVLAQASRPGFGVVHFAVQGDHLHLLVEANGAKAISAGMRSLNTRLAQAINRALRRTGRVIGDRHHARALRHRSEVRHVLVYVLLNWRKHFDRRGIDPCSSGPWFDGWSKTHPHPPPSPSPVAAATTWLLSTGWRLYGLIDPHRDGPRR